MIKKMKKAMERERQRERERKRKFIIFNNINYLLIINIVLILYNYNKINNELSYIILMYYNFSMSCMETKRRGKNKSANRRVIK